MEKLFFDRIFYSPCGCWYWTGCYNTNGYGYLKTRDKKNKAAHRLSWELHYGKIPEGIHVLHRCDNTKCVNPQHLFLGTDKDNVDDMIKKGRRRAVSRKLTAEQAIFVKESNLSQVKMAAMLGVSQMTISRYKRGIR